MKVKKNLYLRCSIANSDRNSEKKIITNKAASFKIFAESQDLNFKVGLWWIMEYWKTLLLLIEFVSMNESEAQEAL